MHFAHSLIWKTWINICPENEKIKIRFQVSENSIIITINLYYNYIKTTGDLLHANYVFSLLWNTSIISN